MDTAAGYDVITFCMSQHPPTRSSPGTTIRPSGRRRRQSNSSGGGSKGRAPPQQQQSGGQQQALSEGLQLFSMQKKKERKNCMPASGGVDEATLRAEGIGHLDAGVDDLMAQLAALSK